MTALWQIEKSSNVLVDSVMEVVFGLFFPVINVRVHQCHHFSNVNHSVSRFILNSSWETHLSKTSTTICDREQTLEGLKWFFVAPYAVTDKNKLTERDVDIG